MIADDPRGVRDAGPRAHISKNVDERLAVLLVGHGAPENPEDARAYLAGILGPADRPEKAAWFDEMAARYAQLGGSPYNRLMESQARHLHDELARRGRDVAIVCGMRNWTPYLADVVRALEDDGVRHIVAVILALPRCGRSWDHYADAVREAAKRSTLTFVTDWWEHPSFVRASAALLAETLASVPGGEREILFSAHSVPVGSCPECVSGARTCSYERQVETLSERVAAAAGLAEPYRLCYQGKSRTAGEWCGPYLKDVALGRVERGLKHLVVHPIGFLSDHVEIRYDLDESLAAACRARGCELHRVPTISSHALFIEALADTVQSACA